MLPDSGEAFVSFMNLQVHDCNITVNPLGPTKVGEKIVLMGNQVSILLMVSMSNSIGHRPLKLSCFSIGLSLSRRKSTERKRATTTVSTFIRAISRGRWITRLHALER